MTGTLPSIWHTHPPVPARSYRPGEKEDRRNVMWSDAMITKESYTYSGGRGGYSSGYGGKSLLVRMFLCVRGFSTFFEKKWPKNNRFNGFISSTKYRHLPLVNPSLTKVRMVWRAFFSWWLGHVFWSIPGISRRFFRVPLTLRWVLIFALNISPLKLLA